MGTQVSVWTGSFVPSLTGPLSTVRCRPVTAGRGDGAWSGDQVSPAVAVPVRRRPECVRTPAGEVSNGRSNAAAVARVGGPGAPGRIRRRRIGDRRRPRSGHLNGSGRRLLAPPVDCPRGDSLQRPWERWARLSVTLTVVALLGLGVHAALTPAAPTALVQVVVQPGDTLWALAKEHSPELDPRAVVEQIVVINDLPDGVLPVGLVIQVPSSSPVQEVASPPGSPSVTVDRP